MADERKRRRDAVANDDRILVAARSAFRTHGLSIDMRAIAASAGVGIGTLYRRFPTRDGLLQAAIGADIAALADAGLPPDGSAVDGLRHVFHVVLDHIVGNQVLSDLMAGGTASAPEVQRCVEHLRAVGQQAVERSADDRTLAPDVAASDIAFTLVGLIRIAQFHADGDTGSINHHIDLALRGLSA